MRFTTDVRLSSLHHQLWISVFKQTPLFVLQLCTNMLDLTNLRSKTLASWGQRPKFVSIAFLHCESMIKNFMKINTSLSGRSIRPISFIFVSMKGIRAQVCRQASEVTLLLPFSSYFHARFPPVHIHPYRNRSLLLFLSLSFYISDSN